MISRQVARHLNSFSPHMLPYAKEWNRCIDMKGMAGTATPVMFEVHYSRQSLLFLATRPPSMTVERPSLHVNIQTEKAQSIAIVPIGDMSVLKAYVHMQFRNCEALTVANKMYI